MGQAKRKPKVGHGKNPYIAKSKAANAATSETIAGLKRTVNELKRKIKAARELNERLKGGNS